MPSFGPVLRIVNVIAWTLLTFMTIMVASRSGPQHETCWAATGCIILVFVVGLAGSMVNLRWPDKAWNEIFHFVQILILLLTWILSILALCNLRASSDTLLGVFMWIPSACIALFMVLHCIVKEYPQYGPVDPTLAVAV